MVDVLNKAVANSVDMVEANSSAVPQDLRPAMSDMGFIRCGGNFVRFCLTSHQGRDAALSRIAELKPECVDNYESMSALDMERFCSPLVSDDAQSYYVVSIRPSYARNLVDRQLSLSDMFGGNPDVLHRWSNVYHRTATHQKMLTVPRRIMWYVS